MATLGGYLSPETALTKRPLFVKTTVWREDVGLVTDCRPHNAVLQTFRSAFRPVDA